MTQIQKNNYSKDVFDLTATLIFAYDAIKKGDIQKSKLDQLVILYNVDIGLWKYILAHSNIIRETFQDNKYTYTWLVKIRPNIHMANNLIKTYKDFCRYEQESAEIAMTLEADVIASDASSEERGIWRFLNWLYVHCRIEHVIPEDDLNLIMHNNNCDIDTLCALQKLGHLKYTIVAGYVKLFWVNSTIKPNTNLVKDTVHIILKSKYNTPKIQLMNKKKSPVPHVKKRWTPEMEQLLTTMDVNGYTIEEIANKLERTPEAIQTRLSERAHRRGKYANGHVEGFDIPISKPETDEHIINIDIQPKVGVAAIEHDITIQKTGDKFKPFDVEEESDAVNDAANDAANDVINNKRRWEETEINDLIMCIKDGVHIDEIVDLFSPRTRGAILNKVNVINKERINNQQTELKIVGVGKRKRKSEMPVASDMCVKEPTNETKKEGIVKRFFKRLFS
jgi:hypothetical protein